MENKNNMSLVWSVIVVLALVGVLIFISIKNKTNMATDNIGMHDDGAINNNDTNNTTGASTPANPTAPAPSQTGQVAKTGDTVAMNYTGHLQNGTVFDSNVDAKFGHVTPFTFTLGAGQVIPGWDKGIVGMKVGEKKTLTISPADGYGAQDVKDQSGKVIIPANSTLTFDVELLAIK